MRMIALAQTWQQQGGKAIFLCADIAPALEQRLACEEFHLLRIHAPLGSQEDLRETMQLISKTLSTDRQNARIVLDGYHFGSDYQLGIKAAGFKLLVVDDYGSADFYHADWVLNQNISAREDLYSHRRSNTELLLGTRFALLRREFLAHAGVQRSIPHIALNVLVTLGGSDPTNVTGEVIDALKAFPFKLRIIVSGSNPNLSSLRNAIDNAAPSTNSIDLIVDPKDMPGLMKWADLAVAAGGSTAWELAFIGVPALYFILAKNQHAIAVELHKKEMGICLPDCTKDAIYSNLAKEVSKLSNDFKLREKLSANCRKAVDGNGSRRVVEILKKA